MEIILHDDILIPQRKTTKIPPLSTKLVLLALRRAEALHPIFNQKGIKASGRGAPRVCC
jgi:hypothetical protein